MQWTLACVADQVPHSLGHGPVDQTVSTTQKENRTGNQVKSSVFQVELDRLTVVFYNILLIIIYYFICETEMNEHTLSFVPD